MHRLLFVKTGGAMSKALLRGSNVCQLRWGAGCQPSPRRVLCQQHNQRRQQQRGHRHQQVWDAPVGRGAQQACQKLRSETSWADRAGQGGAAVSKATITHVAKVIFGVCAASDQGT
jgi:hypothetical protein